MLLIGGIRQRSVIGPEEDNLGASSAHAEIYSNREILIPEIGSLLALARE